MTKSESGLDAMVRHITAFVGGVHPIAFLSTILLALYISLPTLLLATAVPLFLYVVARHEGLGQRDALRFLQGQIRLRNVPEPTR